MTTHIHRWILEPPHGPTTHAACATCPDERDFPTWTPDANYKTRQQRPTNINRATRGRQ